MRNELVALTAVEAVTALKRGDVRPRELVAAAYDRIDDVNGPVNALPTLCRERAEKQAAAIEEGEVFGGHDAAPGWLAGLPVSVKDLEDVAGVRSTQGSPIFADYVPKRSDIMVERLEEHGAITIGKSNTPEFGAGANTFNEVFGITRNPWNTDLTCGGSSGGAAVSLATGMCWLATGSDLGGSLRTPASFCNVVGFRPSPGVIARSSLSGSWSQLSVRGPMARTVEDVALMLDAMAGWHIEDPISRPAPPIPFLEAARTGRPPRRVAFSETLGVTPVDPDIRRICREAVRRFEDMGAEVDFAEPDLSGALEVFQVLRAAEFVQGMAELYETRRDQLKPDVIWNIELGMKLSADRIGWANRQREEFFRRMVDFYESYDLLVSPAAIVPPFPVEQRYLTECDGTRFDNYVDWLILAGAITLTGCPAVSVPAAFTEQGLPIGLQLVGPPRGEADLLASARHFEDASGHLSRNPIEPRTASNAA